MQILLDDMDQALAAHGIPYVEVGPSPIDPTFASDWRTRSRPESTGDFMPEGVLCHHTASPAGTSAEADLNVILCGNGSAPGPISQLYIDRGATVYLVAAGRANHGGSGVIPGEDEADDMNCRLVGIEVANDGVGERWPDPQVDVYAAVVAALIDFYGWPLDMVLLHGITGPPAGNHKIDPAGPWLLEPNLPGGGAGTWDLDLWRQYVADHALPPGDDDVTDQDKADIARLVWAEAVRNQVAGVDQPAGQLLGWTHQEAANGSLSRQAGNMMTGELAYVLDLIRFCHYEASTANAKCDQILERLQ